MSKRASERHAWRDCRFVHRRFWLCHQRLMKARSQATLSLTFLIHNFARFSLCSNYSVCLVANTLQVERERYNCITIYDEKFVFNR